MKLNGQLSDLDGRFTGLDPPHDLCHRGNALAASFEHSRPVLERYERQTVFVADHKAARLDRRSADLESDVDLASPALVMTRRYVTPRKAGDGR